MTAIDNGQITIRKDSNLRRLRWAKSDCIKESHFLYQTYHDFAHDKYFYRVTENERVQSVQLIEKGYYEDDLMWFFMLLI